MKGGYRFLEHSSDVYVEAWGDSLEEAFENAAKAMFDAMTDLSKVAPSTRVKVEAEGVDVEDLLYSWLEALLVKYDVEGLLFSKFNISRIQRSPEGFKLEAEAFGEPLNLEKHPSKVEIKAVTYHMMEVKKEDGRTVVRVLFDI